MPKIIRAFKVKSTWQLCFLYSVVFGGFVAFSNYLPTYLNNIYDSTLKPLVLVPQASRRLP